MKRSRNSFIMWKKYFLRFFSADIGHYLKCDLSSGHPIFFLAAWCGLDKEWWLSLQHLFPFLVAYSHPPLIGTKMEFKNCSVSPQCLKHKFDHLKCSHFVKYFRVDCTKSSFSQIYFTSGPIMPHCTWAGWLAFTQCTVICVTDK